MKQYIIAIDQSTSGTKVLLVDEVAKVVVKKTKSHKQHYPQPGWVEHDPLEIYENVKQLLNEILKNQIIPFKQVKGLSITNQRETIVVWDQETGIPIYNAIVWQCRRTADMCDELKKQGYESVIHEKTGLTLDPYFSASKVKWIFDYVEGAREKAATSKLLVGTIDSWLIWKLTKGKVHATDYTNASRTLLFNISSLEWDQELLDLFNIPKSMLPEVKSSNEIFGHVAHENTPLKGLPISGIIGDSQAALFGQKCFELGMAKATYGTGTSVLMYTGNLIRGKSGLVTSIAWGVDGKVDYALEGIIHSTGDTINWVKNQLELIEDVNELEPLANSIPDNQGVYLIPAFVGLGAPHWASYARAAIVGMDRRSGKAHVARAALESIAYQVKDVAELIYQKSGILLKELNVDGGATINRFLMQFQADMLGVNVKASKLAELSAMGSVYLAGLGFGIWKSTEEISRLNQEFKMYLPEISTQLREKWKEGWDESIRCVLMRSN